MTDTPSDPKPPRKAGHRKDPNRTGPYINVDGSIHASSGSGPLASPYPVAGPQRPYTGIPDADVTTGMLSDDAPPGAVNMRDICPAPNYDVTDPNSRWYYARRKFTPELQTTFLHALERYGRVGIACRWAGVSNTTVAGLRKSDPEFNDMCVEALHMYNEQIVGLITEQARTGILETRTNAKGDIVGERRVFETQIRLAMLRRADNSYIEKREETVTVQGGAVIVPAPVDGVSDWATTVAKHKEIDANRALGGGSKSEPE